MSSKDMELAIREEQAQAIAPSNIFGVAQPEAVIERASQVAAALKDVLKRQNLVMRIGQKEHVLVEGWTLLGSMLGIFPVVEWTRPIFDNDGHIIGYEARVVATTRHAEVIGAAEAMCLKSERFGRGKDDFAIKAMAQTRATSRALRGPLGFVVVLAGYEAVGPEEMDVGAGTALAQSADMRDGQSAEARNSEVAGSSPARGPAPTTVAEGSAGEVHAVSTGFGEGSDDSAHSPAEDGARVVGLSDAPFSQGEEEARKLALERIEELRLGLDMTMGALLLRARKDWGISMLTTNLTTLTTEELRVMLQRLTELTVMLGTKA